MVDRGLDNLQRAAAEHTRALIDEICDDALGKSPIEKLFFTALKARLWLQASEYTYLIEANDEQGERAAMTDARSLSQPSLIVRPQAQLEGWRVDFLVHAFDFARAGGAAKWKPLIVECDGHDFHERTKEQAAKDRSRDRAFQLLDYSVLRFTGSEIYKDAWACAAQVTDWAVKGFP